MLFEFEPSGINDTYLRITRHAASCILAPVDAWNGLIRLNYAIAAGGQGAGQASHIIFRSQDIGWDDGRFYWKGKAFPVLVSTLMVDVLNERGLLDSDEAERLVFSPPAYPAAAGSDEELMLRALLAGCSFLPIYDTGPALSTGAPPKVTGFVLKTLGASDTHILKAQAGIPALTTPAREMLHRELET